jgi:hypothetical protein
LIPAFFTFYIHGVLKLKKKYQRQKVNVSAKASNFNAAASQIPTKLRLVGI